MSPRQSEDSNHEYFLSSEVVVRELDANVLIGLMPASRDVRAIMCDWPTDDERDPAKTAIAGIYSHEFANAGKIYLCVL